MILTALVFIGVIYALVWYYKTKDYKNKINKLKCEPYIPVLGHALQLGVENGDILNSIERMWNKLGKDKFLLRLGPMDQVVITKPEDIEESRQTSLKMHRQSGQDRRPSMDERIAGPDVMEIIGGGLCPAVDEYGLQILTSTTLRAKNEAYGLLTKWLGQGLLTSDGNSSIWKVHRKLLTPAFHFKVLESYVEIYDDDANNFVKEVIKKQNQDLETINLVTAGISSSLARSALGVFFSSEEDMKSFKDSTQRVSKLINGRVFSFWKSIDLIYNLTNEQKELQKEIDTIHSTILKTYNKKKEELKDVIEAIASGKTSVEELTTKDEFSKRKLTFIEILLLRKKPNGEPLTPEEINDEVNTFVFGGVETTSHSLCLTMYALAKHPDIQEKVYQEQLEITNGDLAKPITYNDIQNMKYLDRVMKESLRLYPGVPMFGRKIVSDICFKDGTELPAGCSLIMLPFLTHRNPDLFKDPLEFDPDRFLVNIPTYSYYPFSAGSRNCIGQKLANTMIKTWLATIVRSCIIRPSDTKDIHLTMVLTISSKTGVHLQFEKR